MVSTRSNTRSTKQAHIEDSPIQDSLSQYNPTSVPTQKRKAEPTTSSPAPSPEAKKQKTTPPPPTINEGKDEETTSLKKETKAIAKSRSGQTKLSTTNVTEELASPAATKEYKKSPTTSPKDKKITPLPQQEASSTTNLKQEDETKAEQEEAKEEEPPLDEQQQEDQSDIIHINRSPVLDLWAATVTHFIHPNLPWETCLAAGSAIATLCAVSKGRSIGLIDPAHDTNTSGNNNKDTSKEGNEITIMHFPLQIKDKAILVGGKDRKTGNEGLLMKKYGGEGPYTRVKKAFEEALETWKDDTEGLNRVAFAMYEDFRPSVAAGQKGWGKKGELSLDRCLETIAKG